MPTYRGNRGNLLQHWVLVELLECIRAQKIEKPCFVDAYSMSPTPTRSPKANTDPTAPEFDRVRSRLAGGRSRYEGAWRMLSQSLPSEYPSSAAFVHHCWPGSSPMLLCEADEQTADDIEGWLAKLDGPSESHELHRGDWRDRFAQAVRADCDAYYFSFDPNMYEAHDVRSPRPENMYRSDIDLIRRVVQRLPGTPIVVQLSTYSVNNGNSQSVVCESVVPSFIEIGFDSTCVRADQSMMSVVFSRGVTIPPDLEDGFRSWLARSRG